MWCWWCCHPFEGEPLEMPKKYDEMRRKFYTYGKFCSWSCMKAFAIDNYGVNLGGRIMGNIMCMRKQMYGVLGPVRMAPKRYELDVFGVDDHRGVQGARGHRPRSEKTHRRGKREGCRSVLRFTHDETSGGRNLGRCVDASEEETLTENSQLVGVGFGAFD